LKVVKVHGRDEIEAILCPFRGCRRRVGIGGVDIVVVVVVVVVVAAEAETRGLRGGRCHSWGAVVAVGIEGFRV